jgi:hypothetical protein
MYADLFKQVHHSNHIGKPDQYSPHVIGAAGYEVWSNGEWANTIQGKDWGPIDQTGYWGSIDVREDGVLKVRMQTWNITPPPATPSPRPAVRLQRWLAIDSAPSDDPRRLLVDFHGLISRIIARAKAKNAIHGKRLKIFDAPEIARGQCKFASHRTLPGCDPAMKGMMTFTPMRAVTARLLWLDSLRYRFSTTRFLSTEGRMSGDFAGA